MRPRNRRPADRHERGAGLIGLTGGLLVYLLLLLFAVQLLFNLYARSVITGTAYAATRTATRYHPGMPCEALAPLATARIATGLGRAGTHARIEPSCLDGGRTLRIRVVVTPPSALPTFLGGLDELRTIDRTVEVALEQLQS